MTIQEVAQHCQVDGKMIAPPSRDTVEIPREAYMAFKKVMENNLGKWKGGKTHKAYGTGEQAAMEF